KTSKIISMLIAAVVTVSLIMSMSACNISSKSANDFADVMETIEGFDADQLAALNQKIAELSSEGDPAAPALAFDYGDECYEKIKYIDKVLHDRDCYTGANSKLTQKWILWNLFEAGYTAEEAYAAPFTLTNYYVETELKTKLSAVQSYALADENHYKRSGRNYVVDEEGTYVKVNVTMNNIVAVKKGQTDEQIIVGMHFDGDGTGDNGSGVSLGLTTAQHIHDVETYYTIVFVFFNAEEYGCYGSTAYANAMTDEEVAKTKYMINMDSLVCGDYCNLYGGVQDDKNKTVNGTEAYENAMNVAATLGIEFKTNPWTYDHPAPGYDAPDYASPSTGDWSDHKGFKNRGIKYVYFEATNWEIPGPYYEYDGYGETYLIGMLMNTSNDYLEYIETYFPGRIQSHISKFSALLNALLVQSELDF
ncbi:MAG: M28 family peptidase, partial [Clostridia bacterium]|nr:M28 family peptidase [Clostridia bacterium]